MGKKTNKTDKFAEREAEKYENPIPSREFILDYLAQIGRPSSYRQIADGLEIATSEQKEALRRRLLAMVRDGQLHQNRRGAYGLIEKMELIPGHLVGHKDGFGFLIPDDGSDDLFLNARQMRTAFHGDKVLARVSGIDHRGRREGVIVNVVEHNTRQLVGRFFTESGISFVQPSNRRMPNDILIPPEARGSAQPGQMVVIEITTQPSAINRPLGKVIEILGDHMAPGMEIDVAIRNHDIPTEWPEDVLKEAGKYKPVVPEESFKARSDFRHLPFVTIDGEDAKDFDDAVYCEVLPKGGWHLYVAIADVGHYVQPHSALDQEALERGNSVYFPGRVIPMLPEVLSNELCSLKPNVNRLTLVCDMMISPTGKIMSFKFHEAVICSHARLTYNQVNAMVEQGDKELQTQYQALFPHLQDLYAVYHILYKARQKRGAIDFDLPETKIIFGPDRKIEKIVALVRNDAHRVIEECMLCANICAAKYLLKNEAPGLYRIHQGPSPEKLQDLYKFLGELGLKMPLRDEPKPKDYANLLKSITERPDANVIQTVLLRSLSQAVYSHENVGHFGLAFEAYAHFTSPIRRYPDLIVHRAIRKVLRKQIKPGELEEKLARFGEHCSMTERRADDATREAIDWLKCEFMMDKVGEQFDGVISSVTNFGLFVALKDVFVEGLVHITALQNDYYQFDAIKHALIGERSGTRYRLGDSVRVQVVRVDLDERKIDFVLAEDIDNINLANIKSHKKSSMPSNKANPNKSKRKKGFKEKKSFKDKNQTNEKKPQKSNSPKKKSRGRRSRK